MIAWMLEPPWIVLLSTAHVLCWAVYVGGAITMELVLRHAQQYMKPSQIAVVCQRSGKRYRWWSFYCLLLLMATGLLLAQQHPAPLDPSTAYGLTVWMLCGLWILQLAILGLLSLRIHPDMHARLTSDMSPEEMQRERARVGVAITRMDRTVRIELFCAIAAMFLGTILHLDSMGTTTGS
ncbi:MAG: CopD family protein [Pseudomonadales bacterium]|nr:CopD family protein [Pseudomonadales bacterium]